MDLISREAAIEAIDELVSTMSVCVSTDECRGMNWMKRRAIAAIEALPTIDPVKHGRWEKLDLWTKPVCSVCGEPCFGLHGFSYETTAYCPNCGARMAEGEEDERFNQQTGGD